MSEIDVIHPPSPSPHPGPADSQSSWLDELHNYNSKILNDPWKVLPKYGKSVRSTIYNLESEQSTVNETPAPIYLGYIVTNWSYDDSHTDDGMPNLVSSLYGIG